MVYSSNFFEIEQIDRAILEAIRLELIALGHLPDKTAMTQDQYATAKKVIADNPNLTLIEVFGVAPYSGKGEEKVNHIIIDQISITNGDVGNIEYEYTEIDSDTFKKEMLPHEMDNINYQITVLTDSQKNKRIIDKIIRRVLPKNSYFQGVNPDRSKTQNKFELIRRGAVNLSEYPRIEEIYQIEVRNVFLDEKILIENVAKLTESQLDLGPLKPDENLDDFDEENII